MSLELVRDTEPVMEELFSVKVEINDRGVMRVSLVNADGEPVSTQSTDFDIHSASDDERYAWLQQQFESAVGSAVVMGIA